MNIDFKHNQFAHCESGVTANLLQHEGIPITEPLAFGIGSGIFFAHIPFLKVGGIPGTTYRIWPGAIFKNVAKRLGIDVVTQKFSNPAKAEQALNQALQAGRPVGMLGGVYYLPYLPEAFRFHFNAHNFVAYGRQNNNYLISDPILEQVTEIDDVDLSRARFAKGTPEPGGAMYFIKSVQQNVDYKTAIKKAIKQSCFLQLSPPLPWFGNKAIGLLAGRLEKYPEKLPPRKAALYLGNIVRMQEEIGTGGAGFRYLYAAFLQEASELLNREEMRDYSNQLTTIGDEWRNFAYNAARIMKMRDQVVSYKQLSEQLRSIGEREKVFFKNLSAETW
jgi:hypothetical protein